MIFFSIFLFVRGHNQPGGGFIGGLIASSSISLYYLSHQKLPKFILLLGWNWILTIGLIFLLLSFFLPLLFGNTFLTGLWIHFSLWGQTISLGTPFVFDAGIYLLIMGSVIIMFKTLES
jgi:multicomponent Na+:H+ antiporter subunit B